MTPFHPISSSEDIQRIADAVKATLGDEIKALVENEVTKAVQPLGAKINHLKEENRSLFFKLDDLEQYGRRPIVRVSGIPETPNENTTEKIVTTLAKTDIPLQSEDIIISHRVEKWSNARDKPRQIIAKLRSVDLKFHLVKNAKNLRRHVATSSVAIIEDLTTSRYKLMFIGRQLFRGKHVTNIVVQWQNSSARSQGQTSCNPHGI